ncbi:MAG: P1 family peptidase, partial [Blastocatellia bacterium]|nr:P1 family peptidase [Blastocatellia bacterium]
MGGYLTDITGIKVGHFTSLLRPTGCTAILVERGAIAGVDVRGGAPGTRETDLLKPTSTIQMVHAITLSGGSAFGLDSATGVMQFLAEKNIGFDVKVAKVPIVPAAVIFDLNLGDSPIYPTASDGYEAAKLAARGPFATGNVGAGAGATVGKVFGFDRATRGGLGTASIKLGNLVVAALVVVNAAGDIIDPETGWRVAGALSDSRDTLMDIMSAIRDGKRPNIFAGQNTTLGVVATNARLTKTDATKLAEMAHAGLARTINPVHTPFDGDTIFALSTSDYSHA